MYKFTVPLSESFISPVVSDVIENFNSLIDTGATIPVLQLDSRVLTELGCHCKIPKASINGFGGKCDGVIFRIPKFKLGELIYAPFDFFTPIKIQSSRKSQISVPIVLSASMFYDTIYEINSREHKIEFKVNSKKDLENSFELELYDNRLRSVLNGEVLFNEPFNAPMFSVFYNQISTENINKKEELNKLRKIMIPILVNNQDIKKGLKLCQETLPNLSQDQIIKYVNNLKRKLDIKNKNFQR